MDAHTRRDALRYAFAAGGTALGGLAGLAGCLGDDGAGGGGNGGTPTGAADDPTESPDRTTTEEPPTGEPTDPPDETPGGTPIDPDSLPGYVRPEGDPEAVPADLDCEDEAFERHPQAFEEADLSWGEVDDAEHDEFGGFALRVNELSFERGEEVRVTLTNVSGEDRHTGNRHKYNFQVYTETGWRDVRGWSDGGSFGYTDEAVGHPPGEGFEWTFELTEAGVVAGHAHGDSIVVCPDLRAGRYRFAFWEPLVGVAFDLAE